MFSEYILGESFEYSDVYTNWCEPIVAALWERNEQKIQAKLSAARSIVDSGMLFEDEIEILDTHLTYLEFQGSLVSGVQGNERLRQMFSLWITKLETTSKYEQVNQLRAGLLIQLCISLDRKGLRTLDQKRFHAIETRIGEDGFNSQTWYYIAVWAYKYRYINILEKAFTHFLERVRANEFYNEWSYHLTKLMFNILSMCAKKAELQHLIKLAKDPTQLKVYKGVVWEGATNLNLIDTEVSNAFDLRLKRLESNKDSYLSVGLADQPNTQGASRQLSS